MANKALTEMTLQELWDLFPISIVPYRKCWPRWAEEEIVFLHDILKDYSPVITHIGSTSIEGLSAKPIVDILVEIPPDRDRNLVKKKMEEGGYLIMSESPLRQSFNKGYTHEGYAERVFHVHVRNYGDNAEICFRDYLRTHPEKAKEYENLKRNLLDRCGKDRDAYTAGKSSFVQEVDILAHKKEGERCRWCGNDPLYINYHDEEWGQPVSDDRKLFEFLLLEGAQAGLSWITILRKREGYRKAFHDFDYQAVAKITEEEEKLLIQNPDIVRNRLKIHSAVLNARVFMNIIEEFGSFYRYIMSFFPDNKRIVNDIPDNDHLPVSSPISDAISKDLKRKGMKFFGTTICYSFLQATGFIDDHINTCPFKDL